MGTRALRRQPQSGGLYLDSPRPVKQEEITGALLAAFGLKPQNTVEKQARKRRSIDGATGERRWRAVFPRDDSRNSGQIREILQITSLNFNASRSATTFEPSFTREEAFTWLYGTPMFW
jgi:hypothetical protein